jgi:hypothetical protein
MLETAVFMGSIESKFKNLFLSKEGGGRGRRWRGGGRNSSNNVCTYE